MIDHSYESVKQILIGISKSFPDDLDRLL